MTANGFGLFQFIGTLYPTFMGKASHIEVPPLRIYQHRTRRVTENLYMYKVLVVYVPRYTLLREAMSMKANSLSSWQTFTIRFHTLLLTWHNRKRLV